MNNKNNFLIIGNHPILRYINKKCKNRKEVRKNIDELRKYDYELEIYKLINDNEMIYIGEEL
ncbi:MAG: hypothetical protein ACOCRK_00985 [bacterium]